MILYYSPGSCARVTAIALEEAGLDFEIGLIRLGQGEHKSPGYLAINPKAKVPALSIDGQILTENVAIISYLDAVYPAAHLLPRTRGEFEAATQIADLCFCSSTLHPIVTRICMPGFFAEGDEAQASVKNRAIEMMRPQFSIVEQRLSLGPWWYGDTWSIVDGYLYWVWSRVNSCGFPTADFPGFAQHATDSAKRPSIERALRREQLALDQMRSEGLSVMPVHPLK